MSTFRKPQLVHLPPGTVSRARAFAAAVADTVDDRDSNQTVQHKISDDHFVSKLGEEAVCYVFQAKAQNLGIG